MSDVSVARSDDDAATFRPLTVALMIAIGVVAFAAMLVLGAYVPDLKQSRSGGPHALSNGATGFSGLYRLAEATGRHPRVVRAIDGYDTDDLLILSPPDGATNIDAALGQRDERPTLMVLPKWSTQGDRLVRGWVRANGLFPRFVPEGVLAPATKLKVLRVRGGGPLKTDTEMYDRGTKALARFTAPTVLQTIGGAGLRPIITDAAGRIVLAEVTANHLYVLADPDLISNVAMRDPAKAAAALALLDFLGSAEPAGIAFDVVLNGLGRQPSPLKLAFEPPFLAMTLAVVVVLLLVGAHAFGRFGAAQPRARAIAFGKAALVDNTAALIAKAGREAAMGARYVAVIRERARLAFGVPRHLSTEAADAYLDRIDRRGTFTTLAQAAEGAQHRSDMLAAAQALHSWQQGTTE